MRRGIVLTLAALGMAGLLLLVAAPAAAQDPGWRIEAFDVEIEIAEDGALEVTEVIEVDFAEPSRGIYREIPVRVPVGEDELRRYRVEDVRVRTGMATPNILERTDGFNDVMLRIGSPTITVVGTNVYTISYTFHGALNRFAEHDELWWNVTGDRWDTEIASVTAQVSAPAEPSDLRCFEGRTGSDTPCGEATSRGGDAVFSGGPLAPGEQLDVVVALPSGAVDVAEPVLEPAAGLRRVLHPGGARGTLAAGLGALGLAGLAGVALLTRDRAGAAAPTGGVAFRPPEGLRPAQLRLLQRRRIPASALPATIVDLAVRGHLRIEEVLPEDGGELDWRLVRTVNPDDALADFEQHVVRGLFGRRALELGHGAMRVAEAGASAGTRGADGDVGAEQAASLSGASLAGALGEARSAEDEDGRQPVTRLSSLGGGRFRPDAKRFDEALYDDAMERGLFRGSPREVRLRWAAGAVAVTAVGVAGVALNWWLDGTGGLVFLVAAVLGALALLLTPRLPPRTAEGARLRAEADGFEEFVATAEADRMAFAERELLFAAYLPYAIAFGCVEAWTARLAALGATGPPAGADGWYVSAAAGQPDLLGTHLERFDRTSRSRLRELEVSESSSATSTVVGGSASGSSGFSGGGGAGGGAGGGGGGRW